MLRFSRTPRAADPQYCTRTRTATWALLEPSAGTGAGAAWRDAIAANPEHANAHGNLGRILRARGHCRRCSLVRSHTEDRSLPRGAKGQPPAMQRALRMLKDEQRKYDGDAGCPVRAIDVTPIKRRTRVKRIPRDLAPARASMYSSYGIGRARHKIQMLDLSGSATMLYS